MSGAAVEMNPNTEVGSEGKVELTNNESADFDSFDDMDAPDYEPEKGARKEKKKKDEPRGKEPKDGVKNDQTKDAETAKGPDKKEPKDAKSEKDGKDAEEKEGTRQEQKKEEGKPRAKKHKFTHGETQGDLSGDAVFTIPVDGGKEEVPFQRMVDVYNGAKHYEKQLSTLTRDRDKFTKERTDLENTVKDFSERAAKDPNDAWDFLAELTGGDPIQFKEGLLRKQIDAMKPLMEMNDAQREAWINEQKLMWRENLVAKKEQRAGKQSQMLQANNERAQAMEQHGISDEEFNYHHAGVKNYLQGKEPTTEQIVYASKLMKVHNAVEKAAPYLANHPERDKIMQELAGDMMRDPKMTQGKVEATLKMVFGNGKDGEDNSALRRASANAKKNANHDADDSPRVVKPKGGREYESFDDLD